MMESLLVDTLPSTTSSLPSPLSLDGQQQQQQGGGGGEEDDEIDAQRVIQQIEDQLQKQFNHYHQNGNHSKANNNDQPSTPSSTESITSSDVAQGGAQGGGQGGGQTSPQTQHWQKHSNRSSTGSLSLVGLGGSIRSRASFNLGTVLVSQVPTREVAKTFAETGIVWFIRNDDVLNVMMT